MKKASLILNVVLIAAVVVLYVLHFTGDKEAESSEKQTEQTGEAGITSTGDIEIAYVQIDTLLQNMTMYQDLNENFSAKQEQLEARWSSRYRSFEKEVNEFQDQINKGLITRREAAEREQELSNKRLDLDNQRNSLLSELQEENMVGQNRVINYIMQYLEEYNKNKDYNYILSYSFGGGILYADDRRDITQQVLKGINAKYEREQEASE